MGEKRRHLFQSPVRLLVVVTASIFIVETGIMAFLPSVRFFPPTATSLLDSALLVIIIFPILYFFVQRPLVLQIRERRRAEEDIRRLNEELERRVIERTAELESSNRELEKEIGERRKTEDALREAGKRLRFLSSQLITTQETERRRISRELHDELGQALTLIKLRLRFIEQNFGNNQGEMRKECEDTLAYIDQLVENVRRLSLDLSPSILERLGLTAAIRSLIDSFVAAHGNIAVTCDIIDLDHLFPREAHVLIYRILQEALTNVAKHAQAGRVWVVAAEEGDKVSLSVDDDGRGFAVDPSLMRDADGKGLGLAIMNERVRMLKGTLELWSEEGRGARMTITIPAERAT